MLSAAAETSLTSATLKLDEASFVTAVKMKKTKQNKKNALLTNVSFTRTNNRHPVAVCECAFVLVDPPVSFHCSHRTYSAENRVQLQPGTSKFLLFLLYYSQLYLNKNFAAERTQYAVKKK